MAQTVTTSEGLDQIPKCIVDAAIQNALRVADLTGMTLTEMGKVHLGGSQWNLPAAFLVELGAVLQLGLWEQEGIAAHECGYLPPFDDAVSELSRRAAQGVSAFANLASVTLAPRVLQFSIEHIAASGFLLMGGDVLTQDIDEDAFVELLAEFLFSHRDDLSHFSENQ